MKKKRLWKNLSAWIAFSLMMTSGCGSVSVSNTVETQTTEETVDEVQDLELRAQDDYYGFVNYDDLMEMEVGYKEGSAGSFNNVAIQVEDELNEIIEQVVKSNEGYEPGSDEQLIYDFYWQCVNDYEKEFLAKEALAKPVEEIQNAQTIHELVQILGGIGREYGCEFMYSVNVTKDVYTEGKNCLEFIPVMTVMSTDLEDLYDDRNRCESLKFFTKDILKTFGVTEEEADERANDLVYLLLDIAGETDFSIKYANDYYAYLEHKDTEELSKIMINVPASELEKSLGIENPYEGWYLYDAGQLGLIDSLMTEDHLQTWKDFATGQLVCDYLTFFTEENLKTWDSKEGMTADSLAKLQVKSFFSVELGELYARKFYSEELNASVTAFCQNIIDSYGAVIEDCDWLSNEGKDNMLTKLNQITFYIGAPAEREIDPKAQSIIGNNSYETVKNLNSQVIEKTLSKVGEIPSESGFMMEPQTVNACYNQDNTVTIPFGIMHAPFYDVNATQAENLGGLGMVLCHEISHGFDSNCMDFDMNGLYNPSWIGEADRQAFENQMEKVKNYYSNFTIMNVYHVDGELTLGENFADLGAMECLMKMAKTNEERTQIFENYAKIWCSLNISNYAIESLSLDVHSPGEVRVNAVLSSCDEFYEIYDVKEGDGMYVSPEERVSRW